MPSGMGGPNGMMNMGPGIGGPPDFHLAGGYGPMVGGPMVGPGPMGMGGPYPGYPPPMFAPYNQHPGHSYPGMPSCPPGMYPGGGMMGGMPGAGGPPNAYGPYYMNPGPGGGAPGSGYPPPYGPHHQVYASLPAIPPVGQAARPGGPNPRRLGDRISRHFADEGLLGGGVPPDPHHHNNKRGRLEGGPPATRVGGMVDAAIAAIAPDPRSKTVLAYNDLDVQAGDEVVLNY